MNNYTEFSYGIFLPNNFKKLEKHEIITMLCISTIKSHVTDEATRHVPCMTIYDMTTLLHDELTLLDLNEVYRYMVIIHFKYSTQSNLTT